VSCWKIGTSRIQTLHVDVPTSLVATHIILSFYPRAQDETFNFPVILELELELK